MFEPGCRWSRAPCSWSGVLGSGRRRRGREGAGAGARAREQAVAEGAKRGQVDTCCEEEGGREPPPRPEGEGRRIRRGRGRGRRGRSGRSGGGRASRARGSRGGAEGVVGGGRVGGGRRGRALAVEAVERSEGSGEVIGAEADGAGEATRDGRLGRKGFTRGERGRRGETRRHESGHGCGGAQTIMCAQHVFSATSCQCCKLEPSWNYMSAL